MSLLSYFKMCKDEKNSKEVMQCLTAIIFDNGFGISPNKTRALFYYEAASDLSNIYAPVQSQFGNTTMVKMLIKM